MSTGNLWMAFLKIFEDSQCFWGVNFWQFLKQNFSNQRYILGVTLVLGVFMLFSLEASGCFYWAVLLQQELNRLFYDFIQIGFARGVHLIFLPLKSSQHKSMYILSLFLISTPFSRLFKQWKLLSSDANKIR